MAFKNKTLVVFGASGRTGKEVVSAGVSSGYKIRAIVRKKLPDKEFPIGVDVVVCDNKNINELNKVITDASAVVIVFGQKPPYKDIFCGDETKNIVKSMLSQGVKRLICQTGAMIGEYPTNRSLPFSIMCRIYNKNNPTGYKDRLLQEKAVKESSLDWTIIKPPRLTDSGLNHVKAGEGIKVGMLSSASRKSLAKFIIEELTSPKFVKKAVFICN